MGNLVKWRDKRRTAKENKALCRRYPFLIPWHRFTGQVYAKCNDRGKMVAIPQYDWSYTELDDMPGGWRTAFGMQLCEEIRNDLIEHDDLERWKIVQMKEKYGRLEIYDNGHVIGSKVFDIIEKYGDLSERTCICCGKPATRMALGWISPYCDNCCPEFGAIPIEEYFMEDEKKDDAGTD